MSTKSAYDTTPDAKVAPPPMKYFTRTIHHDGYARISSSRPELSAKGKNVVVSGGGTGIGKAIALNFVRAGARSVFILGRREDRLKEAVAELTRENPGTGTMVLYKAVDLTKRAKAESAFDAIAATVGKLDLLVSNAAALPTLGPLRGLEVNDFMRGFDANVLSAFNAVQAFLRTAVASPMIINISTALAHFAPMPGAAGYGVSKAANLKMMDYFAAENPEVHVVNVQPGTVATEMSAQVGVVPPDQAELPGQFCVWLASPEAAFFKSKFVWANWDVDELMERAEEIKTSRLFTWGLEGVPM